MDTEAALVMALERLAESARQHRVTSASARRAAKQDWETYNAIVEAFPHLSTAVRGTANHETHAF